MLKPWGAPKDDCRRKNKTANHNRNAVELSRHFIEWQDGILECKDCGRRLTESNFKLMANEPCEWERGSMLTYKDIKNARERRFMERRWSRRAQAKKTNIANYCGTAFKWIHAKKDHAPVKAA